MYAEAGEALESWICDGKTHVIEGKLIAGHTYLLKELEAPDGYTVQKPMIFTVSDTGRGLTQPEMVQMRWRQRQQTVYLTA